MLLEGFQTVVKVLNQSYYLTLTTRLNVIEE
jgi:hypothetical protein